jgi:hypothetical protein
MSHPNVTTPLLSATPPTAPANPSRLAPPRSGQSPRCQRQHCDHHCQMLYEVSAPLTTLVKITMLLKEIGRLMIAAWVSCCLVLPYLYVLSLGRRELAVSALYSGSSTSCGTTATCRSGRGRSREHDDFDNDFGSAVQFERSAHGLRTLPICRTYGHTGSAEMLLKAARRTS